MNVETLKLIFDWIGLTIVCVVLGWEVIVNYREWYSRYRQSEDLLRSVLTCAQYHQLMRNGYLDIPSLRDPGCIYRVPLVPGRVKVVKKGQQTASLCLRPLERVPDADQVVIHKLMIEADEENYLQTANTFTPMRIDGWDA
jgi:hypothetical protein